jgi:ketosteroid isomerase-like protein
MCEAFVAADYARSLALLSPDVEWLGTIGGLDEGKLSRGHSEVIDAFVDNQQAWESIVIEPQRFFGAGADLVVAFWHDIARGRVSGAEVETDTGVVYTVREGLVVRVQPYMDRAEALRAAGLDPGDD